MSVKKKHIDDNLVNEPMAVYHTQPSLNPFGQLLSGKFSSDLDIIKLTRSGLSKKVLTGLAQKIAISLQELSDIMHISDRTFHRFDDSAIIKTEYSEKAVELARLYTRGAEVFGSMDKFKLWMKSPAYVFNNETPLSLLDTSAGFNLVFTELGRIEHGIFA
ncbi:type II RES/Xre toxin-antitoxin system antitoxin [Mucilaginibacter ginkgonis]|uniref:DUF2384 domain-containing protein n=1 Tax=Mucilaginibacter ginkgonis TaxID=2682091 RepID=A0A6I4I0K3_9SPHI|nr:antitoxin Xre/MbcA/ParS toxin-binding domain-containing protein [Mucilaginibacter ginkgonis]QQL48637.1 DUF2384 domain-containing protein [Mucilaginibacter ginkgonis]